ncbi:RIO1 family regulatory kinase/ATPase [Ktedonospora formicarum]|uniref:non-specific serine/threonine protein kinase n=1 Tax=Ktedonospora formicarum TaxID=2778364 RepID=A0A8J3I635_9CHLR|nr:RIO1 family regulatory kinase/ATPase [Ktedonospora formicarum]GHO50264.1 hypothetical protein KSX_84270 [Ktedonospora formicarum]
MYQNNDDFEIYEDEAASFIKIKDKYRHGHHPKPTRKTSYESNEDVQRWLKEQASESSASREFHPTMLSSQRDGPWIHSSLSQFYEEDLISDVLYIAKSGKEASVFCCVAHPDTAYDVLAAKVYRPRMFRNLRNDAIYRQSRVVVDEHKKAMGNSRAKRVMSRKNAKSRALQVSSWIGFEYETQIQLYEAGVHVPKPLSHIGNAILMEYLGDREKQAPLLREVILEAEEARPLFEQILADIELMFAHNRVHGDLSEYNILYWEGAVMLIDFAQAVDPRHSPAVLQLLQRDIERVCQYFSAYGIEASAQEIAYDLWSRYMGPLPD